MLFSLTPTNETLYGEARQYAIDHDSGYVSRMAFQVNIGLFTGLALVTVAVRLRLRMKYMRRILLDDYFLLFAAACLVTSMAILYWQCSQLYLLQALEKIPAKIIVTADEVLSIMDLNVKMQTFMSLNWTTISAVKFSFLAYFSALVRTSWPKLKTYLWFVVIFTVATWAFLTASTFIICPYYGMDRMRCKPDRPLDIGLISLTTVLDVATDILVVSFPIIIIHQARMSRQQKVALGTVLSLSLAMVVVAIMRLVGSLLVKGIVLDQEWEFFWQQLEGSVAVMMGSLTAFRGAFNRDDDTGDAAARSGNSGAGLVRGAPRRWWGWRSGATRRGQQYDEEAGTGIEK